MTREVPIDPVLEEGYDVRLKRDDFAEVVEAWLARSEAVRQSADCSLDCVYGKEARDRIDVFRCGVANAPLFVFIHGGYWQRGDKSIYSFVAEPFLASGADVALIGYPLCPDVDLAQLTDRIRSAVAWLWENARSIGVSADRINLSGHSAGGHLTAMMLATDWPSFDNRLPRNLLNSGIPISGLYQLEPLRRTTISDPLGLDDGMSRRCSPYFREPSSNAPVLVTLGGAETQQFHWQSDQFVEAWSKHEIEIAHHVEPDVDHFDVVNRLADPASSMFQKTRGWLR